MSVFRFKQFGVAHDKCAMKVNTDGVLLGAWADVNGAKRILDVGTGTGVIALMIAQRNNGGVIDAIDIDEQAFKQAGENFAQSPWASRLKVYHSALQQFNPSNISPVKAEPKQVYDLIVSNPPYFIDDYKSGNQQKDIARHNLALNYEELITGVNSLLAPTGSVCLVLPVFNLPELLRIAAGYNLFVCHKTIVTAVEHKAPYLVLIQLKKAEQPETQNTLCIQNAQGEFTTAYKQLTKDFYLKF